MKKRLNLILIFVVYCTISFSILSCENSLSNKNEMIDIQGHRGCRGLFPENTIPAFKHALDLGVHTLELDVVATKEGIVYVSHEPFFNHEIATAPNDVEITKENEKSHNMYLLSATEIETYDVGIKPVVRFPNQKKMAVTKPKLYQMVKEIEAYGKLNDLDPILYNIEIKREPQNDDVFHPKMEVFADLVIDELKELNILDRTTVQCFDVPTLQYIHKKHNNVALVYLVMDMNGHEKNIDSLGFSPAVYSPYYKLVDEKMITYAKANEVKIIPWTVNEKVDMKKLIDLGVDGIISDYPDRLIQIVSDINIEK